MMTLTDFQLGEIEHAAALLPVSGPRSLPAQRD
jgi:hypothetical protein